MKINIRHVGLAVLLIMGGSFDVFSCSKECRHQKKSHPAHRQASTSPGVKSSPFRWEHGPVRTIELRSPPGARSGPGELTEKGIFKRVAEDQKRFWTAPLHIDRQEAGWVVSLVASSAALIATDKDVAGELAGSPPGSGQRFSQAVSEVGAPLTGDLAVAGGLYLAGRFLKHSKIRTTGLLGLQALADTGIVAGFLKAASLRERPTRNGGGTPIDGTRGHFWSGGASFPSGHAMGAFSLAAVVSYRHPRPLVIPIACYAVAGLIGVSRVTAREHFPSDVLVGSVLGFLMGRSIVRSHEARVVSPKSFLVLPHRGQHGRLDGITIAWLR